MRHTRVYHNGAIETGAVVVLGHDASNHVVNVLRCKPGMQITLFNGAGGEYRACLVEANAKAAELRVESYADIHNDSPLSITLLQGISRGERMDTTIQKATELGVSRIIPVICERTQGVKSDRLDRKHQRWNMIATSACEQSGRNHLPELPDPVKFADAVLSTADALKLVLDPASRSSLQDIHPEDARSLTLLIGPEGGLSDNELSLAKSSGFTGIRFGPRILRTETAGPAFIAAAQTLWGDMG